MRDEMKMPEPLFTAWLHHGEPVNAFPSPPGDRALWDHDGYWAKKGYDKAPLYTAEQMRAFAQEATRQAMERAAKVCEEEAELRKGIAGWNAVRNCADAIRALADVAGEKGVGNG